MKYVSLNNLFHFTWEQVAVGFWQRYPNPKSNHVLSEDVLSRSVRDGKLITTRLLIKTNKMPSWGQHFMPGSKHVAIVEESIIDPETKTITTYTRNIGMQRVMSVEEKCVYRQSEENRSWTHCSRYAWIASSVFGLRSTIEVFGTKRFCSNAKKAVEGFDYVLQCLYGPHDIIKDHTMKEKAEKLKEKARQAGEAAKTKTKTIISHAQAS